MTSSLYANMSLPELTELLKLTTDIQVILEAHPIFLAKIQASIDELHLELDKLEKENCNLLLQIEKLTQASL